MTDFKAESCRFCHWWDCPADDRTDTAIGSAECHAHFHQYKNLDESASLVGVQTTPEWFCPQFKAHDQSHTLRPEICPGCRKALNVVTYLNNTTWRITTCDARLAYAHRDIGEMLRLLIQFSRGVRECCASLMPMSPQENKRSLDEEMQDVMGVPKVIVAEEPR